RRGRHRKRAGDGGDRGCAPRLWRKMLELDRAEFEREPYQIRKAELGAGEIIPAGLGVLGGDAIGRNVDALHLVARDGLVVDEADERLDRGRDVPAAGVGLDVAIGDGEWGR